MPAYIMAYDSWWLNVVFLRMAKLWQKRTHYPPARLAWVLFGFVIVGFVITLVNAFADPTLTLRGMIYYSLTGVATLGTYGGALYMCSEVEGGYRPRDATFHMIVQITRLGMHLLSVLLLLFIKANPPLSILFQAICLWAAFYLVTIYLPPERSSVPDAVQIKM